MQSLALFFVMWMLSLQLFSVPMLMANADEVGPFLPPSVLKERQVEAAKKEKEAQEAGLTTPEKIKKNLSNIFTTAPLPDNKNNTNPVGRTAPPKPPFIAIPTPELEEVPPLVIEDPLPKIPDNSRIDNPQNKMGLAYAANELNKVLDLQKSKSYTSALLLSKELDAWLIDATETHIDLYQTLNRVPSARVQASFEKKLGLEFAKLRDRNLLALGELYRAMGMERKSVRPLVQLVQSQSRTELGLKAYKILQEMGFTEELSLTQ